MSFAKVCFIFVLILFNVYCDDVDVRCSSAFCKDFDKECEAAKDNIHADCMIQNTTHNGIFLPYPGPCNCCLYCLRNLDEGEDCTKGEVGQPPSGSVCGNALLCEQKVEMEPEGTCQLISSTPCTAEQFKFDEKVADGTVGHMELREICDRRGLYGRYKCIPGQNCYCRNKENTRIFGDIPYSSIANDMLNCACSTGYDTISNFLGEPLKIGEFLRCQSNGDYDTLQCINDECFCVDAIDGALTYPDAPLVNITLLSNETLPCFNYEVHNEDYYNPCEKEYLETLEAVSIFPEYENETHAVIGITFPNCQLDGYYAPVQKNDEFYYCADPEGKQLENFAVPINDTDLTLNMNCACARARSIIPDEKPECLQNGNYKPIQCRRGFARYVDENGNQIKKETESCGDDSPSN